MTQNLIIGTAGHVDHGKTTLIKALTGDDTDRLEEEQERGLSIDLGFSSLDLNDQLQVGIIDVPGHEKFIKNMLAGAGGVDIGLLVVAADEAIMPQTEEHLAILDLLNVNQGLIAITKSDKVDDEWVELVQEEIKEVVTDTFLEGAPIIPVSAVEGQGLDQLKEEITKITKKVPAKDKQGNVYFPIDRVFSIAGHGTVVTGTLIKGKIAVGDKFEIYPAGIKARVRSLQVHEEEVTTAYPGQRVGVNLAGVDTEEIDRGDVLATADSLVKTGYLDARLELLPTVSFVLKHGDRIRLHLGAKEVLGRVYLLDQEELYPGEQGLVQFRLEETVVANFKERYVLRRYSPMATIGGGQILDSNPSQHQRFEAETISALQIKENGSLEERIELALQSATDKPVVLEDLIKQTSLARQQLEGKLSASEQAVELATGQQSSWIYKEYYQQLKEEIIDYLIAYHQQYHLRWGRKKEELRTKLSMDLSSNQYDLLLADLKEAGRIIRQDAKVRLADFEIEFKPEEEELKKEIMDQFTANKFSPPELSQVLEEFTEEELATEICKFLISNNKLVKVAEDLYFADQSLEEAKELLRKYLKEEERIELAEFRDLLATSRKYALPLLEYFDQLGVTLRKGDTRVLAED
ncbi:selenocysteine-specific translation elongation factor [Halanaerobaculum tunisiense]